MRKLPDRAGSAGIPPSTLAPAESDQGTLFFGCDLESGLDAAPPILARFHRSLQSVGDSGPFQTPSTLAHQLFGAAVAPFASGISTRRMPTDQSLVFTSTFGHRATELGGDVFPGHVRNRAGD